MKIGKRTQELMNIYALSNEDVAFAQLMAAGRTQMEAYCIAYHNQLLTNPDSPQRAASALTKTRPNIINLTRSLQAYTTDSQQAKDKGKQAQRDGRTAQKTKNNITTKDGQLQALREIYEDTTDNKQRQDILKQISDLQQLKHEQTNEETSTIHHFLPMQCRRCPYKPPKTTEKG